MLYLLFNSSKAPCTDSKGSFDNAPTKRRVGNCKFRAGLKLLLTDSTDDERYYTIENFEVIPGHGLQCKTLHVNNCQLTQLICGNSQLGALISKRGNNRWCWGRIFWDNNSRGFKIFSPENPKSF